MTPIMENQVENELEAAIMQWVIGVGVSEIVPFYIYLGIRHQRGSLLYTPKTSMPFSA